jgi:uncharacterized protein
MHILVERINEDGLEIDVEEKPESFPVLSEMIRQGECKFSAPINTTLNVSRIGDMIDVKGKLETTVHLSCSRCLNEYETALKSRFNLTYVNHLPVEPEDVEPKEIEITAQEMGLIYFQGEEINLQDGIQEQVVMAFPIRALCREECKGLCAACGADLNQGDCGCDRKPVSNKFAVLKNLKLDE